MILHPRYSILLLPFLLFSGWPGNSAAFDTLDGTWPGASAVPRALARGVPSREELQRAQLAPHETPPRGLTADEQDLLRAAQSGSTAEIKQVLARGARVNLRDESGDSALLLAVRGGHLDAVRDLLNRGATPDVKGGGGFTPLGYAAMRGHAAMTRVLLRAGAQPDVRNNNGYTALGMAARFNHAAVAQELVRAGADHELFNPEGMTAMGLAAFAGHVAVLAAMANAGVSIDFPDQGLRPPLYWALLRKHRLVVELLRCLGADEGVMTTDIFDTPMAPCPKPTPQ